MRELVDSSWQMGIGGELLSRRPNYQLPSPTYQTWVQHVYSRWVRGGHNLGLSPESQLVAKRAEYKPRGLRTAKPLLTQSFMTSQLGQFVTVNQPVMPIIHTTNKNNNKVNYFKNYLLLIRSPV